jgi:serine/threonine protein kinase
VQWTATASNPVRMDLVRALSDFASQSTPIAPDIAEPAAVQATRAHTMLLALPTRASESALLQPSQNQAHPKISRRGAKRGFAEDPQAALDVDDLPAATTVDGDADTEEDRLAQVSMRHTFFPSDSEDEGEFQTPLGAEEVDERMGEPAAAVSATSSLEPEPLLRPSSSESETTSAFTVTVRSLPQLPAVRRDLPHLDVLPRIAGVGSTAKVYRAVHRESGTLVAVKVATAFFGREEQARFRQVGPHDCLVRLYDVIDRGFGGGPGQQQPFGDLTAASTRANSQPNSRRSSFSNVSGNVPLTPRVSQSPILFVSGAESPHAKRRKSIPTAGAVATTAEGTPLTAPGSRSTSRRSQLSLEDGETLNAHLNPIPLLAQSEDPLAKASHLLFHGALPPVPAAVTGSVADALSPAPATASPPLARRQLAVVQLPASSAGTPSRPPLPPGTRSPRADPRFSPACSRRTLFGGGPGPASASPQESPGGLRRTLFSTGPSPSPSPSTASPPRSPPMSPSFQLRSLRLQHSPILAPAAASSSPACRRDMALSPLVRGAMSPMSAFADRPISVQNRLPSHVRRQMAAAADLRHSTDNGGTTIGNQRTTVYLVLEPMLFSLVDVLQLSQIRHRPLSNVCIRHILRHVLLALQHLHSHGVVMVDVSPGNIMFTDRPSPVSPQLVQLTTPAAATTSAVTSPVVGPTCSAPPSPMTMACRKLTATSFDQEMVAMEDSPASPSALVRTTTAVTIEERQLLAMAVKLVDLGGAIPLGEQPACKWIEPNRRAPELAWISREQQAVTARAYEPSSDVWAVGILALEMVHRELPLNLDRNASVTRDVIQHATWQVLHNGLPAHEHVYPTLLPLIRRMLAFEPSERPTCAELLQSTFFATASSDA